MDKIKYPIGEQSFKEIRKGGFVYVDKTNISTSLSATANIIF